MLWRAEMSLCGVRDGEVARCLESWIAWGELDSAIVAYAERDGYGHRVPVFGSDPIFGGNPDD